MATLSQVLTYNTVTNIVVGDKTIDDFIIVRYACIRRYLYDAGEIIISNDAGLIIPILTSYFQNCGFTLTMDFNGNEIRLKLMVDNTISDDIDFNYNLLNIIK
jgi:hypothetical protein